MENKFVNKTIENYIVERLEELEEANHLNEARIKDLIEKLEAFSEIMKLLQFEKGTLVYSSGETTQYFQPKAFRLYNSDLTIKHIELLNHFAYEVEE